MARIVERLASPTPDLCFYGLAPPKQSTDPERLRAIVEAQKARIAALAPDGLVVYDLQDESDRQTAARPVPCLTTLPPAVYAHQLLGAPAIPKIVYRCVAKDTADSFKAWLEEARPAELE